MSAFKKKVSSMLLLIVGGFSPTWVRLRRRNCQIIFLGREKTPCGGKCRRASLALLERRKGGESGVCVRGGRLFRPRAGFEKFGAPVCRHRINAPFYEFFHVLGFIDCPYGDVQPSGFQVADIVFRKPPARHVHAVEICRFHAGGDFARLGQNLPVAVFMLYRK